MPKTFCPICDGAGTITYWESHQDNDGWTDEWEETYDCYKCEGTGEVEYHSKSEMKRVETLKDADKSGCETTGVACCRLSEFGHHCACGNIK